MPNPPAALPYTVSLRQKSNQKIGLGGTPANHLNKLIPKNTLMNHERHYPLKFLALEEQVNS